MLVVYLALELLRDAVGEFIVVFNPLSSLRVLDGHGRYACSRQRVGLNEEVNRRWVVGREGGRRKHLNAPTTVAPSFSTSWMAAFIVPPVSIHWSTSSTFIPAGRQ